MQPRAEQEEDFSSTRWRVIGYLALWQMEIHQWGVSVHFTLEQINLWCIMMKGNLASTCRDRNCRRGRESSSLAGLSPAERSTRGRRATGGRGRNQTSSTMFSSDKPSAPPPPNEVCIHHYKEHESCKLSKDHRYSQVVLQVWKAE